MIEISTRDGKIISMQLDATDIERPYTWQPDAVMGLVFIYGGGRRIVFPWCNITSYEVIPAGWEARARERRSGL